MDMFSVSREAAQHSSMDRKPSAQADLTARKQSTVYDRRPSSDRRQSTAPAAFYSHRDDLPTVRLVFIRSCMT